jgi:ATP-binding cassette subfamily B protein
VVPQETIIFAASARDNLRYGMWDASDDHYGPRPRRPMPPTSCARCRSGSTPSSGEGGARLSGGQRQRVAIARALLRDAPLLCSTRRLRAGRRVGAAGSGLAGALFEGPDDMVIAHRLATVRAADRIVVMDGGRIVEEGTDEQLQARGGLYARLARLQFEGLAA